MSFEFVAAPGVAGEARDTVGDRTKFTRNDGPLLRNDEDERPNMFQEFIDSDSDDEDEEKKKKNDGSNDGSALRHILLERPEILTCAQRAAVSQSLVFNSKSKPEWLRQHRELCRAELFKTLVRVVFPEGITFSDETFDANTVLKILKDPVFQYDKDKDDYESFYMQTVEMFNRTTFQDDGSEWVGAHIDGNREGQDFGITHPDASTRISRRPLCHRYYKGEKGEEQRRNWDAESTRLFHRTRGETILSKIFRYGGGDENGEIVEMLLRCGANPNTKVFGKSLFEIGFWRIYDIGSSLKKSEWMPLKKLIRHDDFMNPLSNPAPFYYCLIERPFGEEEEEMWDLFFNKFPMKKLNEERYELNPDELNLEEQDPLDNLIYGPICRAFWYLDDEFLGGSISSIIPILERLLFLLKKATKDEKKPVVYIHKPHIQYYGLLKHLKSVSFSESERAVELMVECQEVVSNFIPRGLMSSEFVTELLEDKYAKMASLEGQEKLAARVSVLNMFENLRTYFLYEV